MFTPKEALLWMNAVHLVDVFVVGVVWKKVEEALVCLTGKGIVHIQSQ